jgi:hypothetical protein
MFYRLILVSKIVFNDNFVKQKPSDDMLFYVKPNRFVLLLLVSVHKQFLNFVYSQQNHSDSLPVDERLFVRRWNVELKVFISLF